MGKDGIQFVSTLSEAWSPRNLSSNFGWSFSAISLNLYEKLTTSFQILAYTDFDLKNKTKLFLPLSFYLMVIKLLSYTFTWKHIKMLVFPICSFISELWAIKISIYFKSYKLNVMNHLNILCAKKPGNSLLSIPNWFFINLILGT